jgi:hypothetical protein
MCNCEPLCDKNIKPGKEHLIKHWQTTGAPSYMFTSPCMCNCEPLCDKNIKPGKEHLIKHVQHS